MVHARDMIPWGYMKSGPTMSVSPIASLQKEMDNLYNRFLDGFGIEANRPTYDGSNVLVPYLDIAETKNSYQISIEMPGVEEKNIDIKLTNNVLTIRAEKKTEAENKETDYHRVERQFGVFSRKLRLPEDINTEKIEADYKEGVLSVSIPKKPEAKTRARHIKIQSK